MQKLSNAVQTPKASSCGSYFTYFIVEGSKKGWVNLQGGAGRI